MKENKSKYKIKLIAVYIGNLPEYFPLWLKSCEKNPSINFLVVTDQKKPENTPSNVEFLKTNLNQLKNRFEKELGFTVALESAYKLCDFRPVYGSAFKEKLKGYDFWGHCDIDLIWGDIRGYITDEILERYSKIGGVGHFTIYRNTIENNYSFKLEGGTFDYKEVLMNPYNYAFDEMTGMNMIYKKNNMMVYDEKNYADISPSRKRICLYSDNYKYQQFYWEKGKCYRAYLNNEEVISKEYMYIHFQQKKLKLFINDIEQIQSFVINQEGFKEKTIGIPNIEEIIKNSNYKNKKHDNIEKLKYRVNKIVKFMYKSLPEKKIQVKQKISLKINSR